MEHNKDNSTVRIASRSGRGRIGSWDWGRQVPVAKVRTRHQTLTIRTLFMQEVMAVLTRYDHDKASKSHQCLARQPDRIWCERYEVPLPMELPCLLLPHDSNKLYACSQHLHVSNNGGNSWKSSLQT